MKVTHELSTRVFSELRFFDLEPICNSEVAISWLLYYTSSPRPPTHPPCPEPRCSDAVLKYIFQDYEYRYVTAELLLDMGVAKIFDAGMHLFA